jgi:hypothetical protein
MRLLATAYVCTQISISDNYGVKTMKQTGMTACKPHLENIRLILINILMYLHCRIAVISWLCTLWCAEGCILGIRRGEVPVEALFELKATFVQGQCMTEITHCGTGTKRKASGTLLDGTYYIPGTNESDRNVRCQIFFLA